MPRVFVSSVIDAPAEKVWATIRRFDAVADWLPFVKSSPIEDGGDPSRVGCIRILTQTDGEVFREVLVALSDAERFYSYTSSAHQFPFATIAPRLRYCPSLTANDPMLRGARDLTSIQNTRRNSSI